MDIEIVPYDPEVHGSFVSSEARNAAGKWPNVLRAERGLEYRFSDLVRRATAARRSVVAVVPDDPALFIGFLVSPGPQAIAYAYVKYPLRRMRVASRLAAAVGLDATKPISVAIWTPAASRIAAAGYRLYPAIPNEQERT